MTSSQPPRHPAPSAVEAQAAETTVRHHGPTAERHQAALQRYLGAVSATRADPGSGPVAGPDALPLPRALVADVMHRDVVAAHQAAVFKEIVAALARNRISAVPVIDADRVVVGVVSESDLIAHVVGDAGVPPRGHRIGSRAQVRRKAHAAIAQELMTAPAVTTTPHATVVEAARQAARARVRRLPVVDRHGTLVGIVTRADLLRVFLRADSEIRDEIVRYLRHDLLVDPASVDVEVQDGVVSLSGQLDRALLVNRFVQHVREVSGVVEIANQLTARIDDTVLPRTGIR